MSLNLHMKKQLYEKIYGIIGEDRCNKINNILPVQYSNALMKLTEFAQFDQSKNRKKKSDNFCLHIGNAKSYPLTSLEAGRFCVFDLDLHKTLKYLSASAESDETSHLGRQRHSFVALRLV